MNDVVVICCIAAVGEIWSGLGSDGVTESCWRLRRNKNS